jgi:hypothetical protein
LGFILIEARVLAASEMRRFELRAARLRPGYKMERGDLGLALGPTWAGYTLETLMRRGDDGVWQTVRHVVRCPRGAVVTRDVAAGRSSVEWCEGLWYDENGHKSPRLERQVKHEARRVLALMASHLAEGGRPRKDVTLEKIAAKQVAWRRSGLVDEPTREALAKEFGVSARTIGRRLAGEASGTGGEGSD